MSTLLSNNCSYAFICDQRISFVFEMPNICHIIKGAWLLSIFLVVLQQYLLPCCSWVASILSINSLKWGIYVLQIRRLPCIQSGRVQLFHLCHDSVGCRHLGGPASLLFRGKLNIKPEIPRIDPAKNEVLASCRQLNAQWRRRAETKGEGKTVMQ